jgi:hypothetical protein
MNLAGEKRVFGDVRLTGIVIEGKEEQPDDPSENA